MVNAGRKFGLLGNGPLSNRGCEAIVYGTVKILEQEFGPSQYLLGSFADDSNRSTPKNIKKLALPYTLPRWSGDWWGYKLNNLLGKPEDKSKFLKKLEQNLDLVQVGLMIGGDGYSIDYGHQIIDRLILMGDFLKKKGIPAVVWGASIGPFDKEPEFEKKVAQHFADLDLIVVRDPNSFEYLNHLGVSKNICMAPDPAFVLDPFPCELDQKTEKLLSEGCIGINLSPLIAKYATQNSLDDWRNLVVTIIKQLLAKIDAPILLVPHVTSDTYIATMDDEVLLREVFNSLAEAEKEKVGLLPRNLSSQNLKWVISHTMIFVGARTHSTIAALSSCVPCLSIAYSRKAWGINELIFGNLDWVFSSDSIVAEELVLQIDQLFQNRDHVRSLLQKIIPGKVSEALQVAKNIRAVL